jgi:hypothetical protein
MIEAALMDLKFIDWQEMYRQAAPIVDELEPVCMKYPPHLAMLALTIELASFEVGGRRIDEEIVCEMVRDVFRIRDVADREQESKS